MEHMTWEFLPNQFANHWLYCVLSHIHLHIQLNYFFNIYFNFTYNITQDQSLTKNSLSQSSITQCQIDCFKLLWIQVVMVYLYISNWYLIFTTPAILCKSQSRKSDDLVPPYSTTYNLSLSNHRMSLGCWHIPLIISISKTVLPYRPHVLSTI